MSSLAGGSTNNMGGKKGSGKTERDVRTHEKGAVSVHAPCFFFHFPFHNTLLLTFMGARPQRASPFRIDQNLQELSVNKNSSPSQIANNSSSNFFTFNPNSFAESAR